MTITGRRQRSRRRPATMPMTPGCQPSAATTITGAWGSKFDDCSTSRIAASVISRSTSLRWAFSASSSRASAIASSGIVGRQQARAEVGAADAPAGVDARPEDEAGVEDAGRPLGLGDLHQRLQSGIAPGRHHLQPLRRERAVEAGQTRHVADGAQRGEVEPLAHVRLGTPFEQAAPARLAIERGEQHEGHAGGRQHALPRGVAGTVGIDQCTHRAAFRRASGDGR